MTFMHVGILVEDFDEAIEIFGSRLGITFASPIESRLDNLQTAEGTLDVSIRCTYSKGSAPYIELMQAQESGIFGPEHLGLHHIGMWEPNCAGRISDLSARGVVLEGVQRTPEDYPVMALLAPQSLAGARFELIPEAAREYMEAWIAS
jgi:hypothetical protein